MTMQACTWQTPVNELVWEIVWNDLMIVAPGLHLYLSAHTFFFKYLQISFELWNVIILKMITTICEVFGLSNLSNFSLFVISGSPAQYPIKFC